MPEAEFSRIQKPSAGLKKASMLLVALGAEVSSAVLQKLSPEEIERLTAEIVQLKKLDPAQREHILEECRKALQELGASGGEDYAKSLLENVLGEAKAKEVLGRLTSATGASAFRWLWNIPARQLAQIIKGERPQVLALILGHLPPEQAAQVLASLPEELQGDVALRLTTMQPCDPEVVKNMVEVLVQQISGGENEAFSDVGGSKSMVRILNNVDRTTEKKILDYLTQTNEEIAKQIKEGMFVFEDILSLDDRSIQIILRDVPQEDLRLALKGCPNETREVFFRNMSQRAAETLKEDLENSGPVKKRDVEGAQNRIANIARELDEAGEISLRGSEEELVA